MPYSTSKLPAMDDQSYCHFSLNTRWQQNKTINTSHLLSVISLSNTLMSFRSRSLYLTENITKHELKFFFYKIFIYFLIFRRVSSTKSNESVTYNENQIIKQGWSSVAALHCVVLPDLIKPQNSYSSPKIDLLARRYIF